MKKLLWLLAALAAIVLGHELLLEVIEEGVNLLHDAVHALFMVIFEKGLGIAYEKAQGKAAWASVGVLILIALLILWQLMPRLISLARQMRNDAVESWREARWYKKLLMVTGGSALVFGLLLVI